LGLGVTGQGVTLEDGGVGFINRLEMTLPQS